MCSYLLLVSSMDMSIAYDLSPFHEISYKILPATSLTLSIEGKFYFSFVVAH